MTKGVKQEPGDRRRVMASPLILCLLLLLFGGCASSPRLARWEFTGGPSAQNISALFIDGQNKSHILAGLATGDVFSSVNEGATWKKLSTVQSNSTLHRFIQDPDDANRLFASTQTGLFLSTDSGEAWTRVLIDSTANQSAVRSLVIEPYNTQVMYTGIAGRGLYKSTNGGRNWRPCDTGLDSLALTKSDVYDITIDALKPDILVAAVRGIGVITSTDGGALWMKRTSITGSEGVAPTSVVVHSRVSGTMCFGMDAGSIYKSIDDGRTWSPTRFGSGSNRPVSLVVHPGNPEILYAGVENDVLVSTNFGTTWKSIADERSHVATTIAIAPGVPDPVLYAFGEGIGLKRTTNNGNTWLPVQAQPGGSTTSGFAGNERGDVVHAVVGASVHRWNLPMQTWVPASNRLAGGTISSIGVDADSSSIVYAGTVTGLFKTTDGGDSWFTGSPQMRGKPVSVIATHPIFKTRLLCCSEGALFVSTDRGVQWNLTNPIDERYRVRSFTFSNTNAGLVLAATAGNGVIISTNGGLSWENNRYGLEASDLSAVTLDEKDKHILYAWTERGGGFRSTNKGLVWDRYSPPWPAGQRVVIAFDKYKPSDVVALVGTNQLYYSPSGGGTWFPIEVSPLQGEIVSAYWNSKSATLYAGIREVGVYRISLGEYLKHLFEG